MNYNNIKDKSIDFSMLKEHKKYDDVRSEFENLEARGSLVLTNYLENPQSFSGYSANERMILKELVEAHLSEGQKREFYDRLRREGLLRKFFSEPVRREGMMSLSRKLILWVPLLLSIAVALTVVSFDTSIAENTLSLIVLSFSVCVSAIVVIGVGIFAYMKNKTVIAHDVVLTFIEKHRKKEGIQRDPSIGGAWV